MNYNNKIQDHQQQYQGLKTNSRELNYQNINQDIQNEIKQLKKTNYANSIIKLVMQIGFLIFILSMLIIYPTFKPNYKFPLQTRDNILPFTRYFVEVMFQKYIQHKSYLIAKLYQIQGLNQPSQKVIKMEKQYYQQKYKLQSTFQNQLNNLQFPFCVIIASYNNVKNQRYKLPLNSLFRQDYNNFHIVYIDDASPDKTGQFVKQHVKDKLFNQSKIQIIINQINKGPFVNQYQIARKHCQSHQIAVIIDGDDGLIGTQTLKLLNHFYQTQNLWFVYGNYMSTINSNVIGASNYIQKQILKQRSYRYTNWWNTSHPKTFYVNLFEHMNPDNLMQINNQTGKKQLFKVNADRAIGYEVVQMAGERVKYLNQVLYLYIQATQYSQGNKYKQQDRVLHIIQEKQKEKYVPCLFDKTKNTDKIISEKQANCLQARAQIKNILLKNST